VRACRLLIVHEKQRNAPYTCKSHKRINDPCYNGSRAAANPCNKVKAEKTDKSPVKCAYNNEYKRNFVNDRHLLTAPSFLQRVRFNFGLRQRKTLASCETAPAYFLAVKPQTVSIDRSVIILPTLAPFIQKKENFKLNENEMLKIKTLI
jgi:hypothetical protein